jgi:Tol biopolymer transport system component
MTLFYRTGFLLIGCLMIVVGGLLLAARADDSAARWLLFVSNRDGQRDLYRINPDSGDAQRLTVDTEEEFLPRWSGDGGWLVYETEREIYRMKVNGKAKQKLSRFAGQSHRFPDWSPDGEWIAFVAGSEAASHIYAMRKDGSDLSQLTTIAAHYWSPRWSPTGQTVVYASDKDWVPEAPLQDDEFVTEPTRQVDLYRIDPDGKNEVRLTDVPGFDWYPSWSPDGQWLVFASSRDSDFEIYRMRADGSEVDRLTYSIGNDEFPAWSPDGNWIAFTSIRSGDIEIYLVSPDGEDLHQVTASHNLDVSPAWSPLLDSRWNPVVFALSGGLLLAMSIGLRRGTLIAHTLIESDHDR